VADIHYYANLLKVSSTMGTVKASSLTSLENVAGGRYFQQIIRSA